MRKKRISSYLKSGEIGTIVALGSMIFILVTTLASNLLTKKPQTTSTKAETSTCPTNFYNSTVCLNKCLDDQTCTASVGYPGCYYCLKKVPTATKSPTKAPTITPTPASNSSSGSCTSCNEGCVGKSVGSINGTPYYCCGPYTGKTSGGSCLSYYHNSPDKNCTVCGSNPNIGASSSTGCCTIASICGAYGCPSGFRYVQKWPNVTKCTGNYIACPKFTPYANENEGCYKDASCGSTGSGSGNCTATNLPCPNSSNTYNVVKTGIKYTYYKNSDTSCSNTAYSTYEEVCKLTPTPTQTPTGTPTYICGSSGCITRTPRPTSLTPTGATLTPSACSGLQAYQCLNECPKYNGSSNGNGRFFFFKNGFYYDEKCQPFAPANIKYYCGCMDGENAGIEVPCVNPKATCYINNCPWFGLFKWKPDGTVCRTKDSNGYYYMGKCCVKVSTEVPPLVTAAVTQPATSCKAYTCISACQSIGFSNSDERNKLIYKTDFSNNWYPTSSCFGFSVSVKSYCACNMNIQIITTKDTTILEEANNGNCPVGKTPVYNTNDNKIYCIQL